MTSSNFEEGEEQPFISHLIELRNRLLRIVLVVLVVFLGMTPFANEIYTYLAGPLLQHMPENSSMIAIDVASPFLTPFKLVLVAAVFISIPMIFYQHMLTIGIPKKRWTLQCLVRPLTEYRRGKLIWCLRS